MSERPPRIGLVFAVNFPVFGICFGGQSLAAALGGTVERAPVSEHGWMRIDTLGHGSIHDYDPVWSALRDGGFAAVFHGGIGPLDTRGRGRMVERDTPVECAGVRVRSGDIVFSRNFQSDKVGADGDHITDLGAQPNDLAGRAQLVEQGTLVAG